MDDLEEKYTEIVSDLIEQGVMLIEMNLILIDNLLDLMRIPSMLGEPQMIRRT